MKAGQRNVGSHTAFVDSISGEAVLEMASDGDGVEFIAYRLYDAQGTLTAESKGFKRLRRGLSISCKGGQQLLHIPARAEEPMQYCLYGPGGNLLTTSDGQRTRIFGVLRMNGVAKGWTLPVAEESVAAG
jgi:hypothetical protein